MTGYRLSHGGGRIDRGQSIDFSFNGKRYAGLAGDTLASALLANGVQLVGRSFKLHRPRGIVGAGCEETNALVQLEHGISSIPNVQATMIALEEGLVARSINAWPSLTWDIAGVNDRLRGLFSAGFYYKTFMWPDWHWFEWLIRRAAGLGKVPVVPDPQRYEARHVECDLLVIGGGRRGLAAAAQAARDGKSVLLVDLDQGLPSLEGVRTFEKTAALGIWDHGFVLAASEGRVIHRIRAEQIILATGKQERGIAFANNDLPGIMLAGAIGRYVADYAVAPGRSGIFFVNNDLGWRSAIEAAQCGVGVRAIVDARPQVLPELAHRARAHGIDLFFSSLVRSAHGRGRVTGVTIEKPDGLSRLACDFVGVSGGWNPASQLWTMAGGQTKFNERSQSFQPDGLVANVEWAGPEPIEAEPIWTVHGGDEKTMFVDFQTDVTVADIKLAARENYRSVEHLKRYTVLGMGVDQGKLSSVPGAMILAETIGAEPGTLSASKVRPPFVPTAFGLIGADLRGERFRPRRYLPAHEWHVREGAVFEDFGWERPAAYPVGGEDIQAAAEREAAAVRSGVGLFDGSPLGKILVAGPEAAAFLDRVYVGTPSTLKPGRIRYGLVLNENGTILDDGVYARLQDGSFLLSPSSAFADRMVRLLEDLLQCEWPMDVVVQDVTEQYAVWTVAGPNARNVLEALQPSFVLSSERFPHLSVREGQLDGSEVRIQRVSFSGELSYEIQVPAGQAVQMGDALMAAGKPYGLVPYGIEALEILRIEKGYIHVGTDTDSETQPGDIGFGGAIAKKQSDFLGRRALTRRSSLSPNRKQLVGLTSLCGGILPVGGHVRAPSGQSGGFVTSSQFSPVLGRGVALGLVEQGQRRLGEIVEIVSLGKRWQARISETVAYDREGGRLDT
ncbi:2Fe-2S iron-sulfur cluster-binding protein [Sphingopyxis microcysteis]|uniref:2Fe-2S iron-sulfur cluster-binding protein n=1 Tax=Sphingopyxis microcysteis TaxID=2484145 RepID=UPI001445BD0B|nr:2Fe-2S iron-sulfur cluster-binding protein [Sphingopyxis microcysteis]